MFREWLHEYASVNSKSATKLGKLCGVTTITMSKYIQGVSSPNIDKAERILNILGYELKIVKKNDKGGNE